MAQCDCYRVEKEHRSMYNIFTGETEYTYLAFIGKCMGTRECQTCNCGGDESKCDFYDYIRERASGK